MNTPPTRLFIGLMSGTSVDAIDAALVKITTLSPGKYAAKVLRHLETPWPKKFRERLLSAMAPATTTTQEICLLNAQVAQHFANAVAQFKLLPKKITAIGSHGQTICHLPDDFSTLQIGDPSIIAALTGITTVGNFRPADMAVGGQGAPLVPWVDKMLLTHKTKTRCTQNIGGIANVTFLPPSNSRGNVLAFDTGPGNMLMDAVVSLATKGKQRYDRNGQLAKRGSVDETLLRSLKAHPYFKKHPPKSTGREDFGETFARKLMAKGKLENLLCTLAKVTAWSIADGYRRFLPRMPDEVILCGGGADNPVLTHMLAEELGPTIMLRRIDEFGIPNKAKEAASFALLAAATLDGVPANLPSVTGASKPLVLGVIARP